VFDVDLFDANSGQRGWVQLRAQVPRAIPVT
jgi:hypothetical protein